LIRATVFGVVVCAFIAATGLTGCSEERATEVTGEAVVPNPYEWVGELHNEGLEFAILQIGGRSKVEMGDVVDLVDQFLVQNSDKLSTREARPGGLDWAKVIEPAVGGKNRFLQHLADLEEDGAISNEFRAMAEEAVELTWRGDMDGLRSLEETVRNQSLVEAERIGVLSAIAVGSHSNQFWQSRTPRDISKAATWRRVVTADLCGALGGAIAGGIIGGGGGALAGAIGGAVGASTGEFLLGP
jgi:hypothetical protein